MRLSWCNGYLNEATVKLYLDSVVSKWFRRVMDSMWTIQCCGFFKEYILLSRLSNSILEKRNILL